MLHKRLNTKYGSKYLGVHQLFTQFFIIYKPDLLWRKQILRSDIFSIIRPLALPFQDILPSRVLFNQVNAVKPLKREELNQQLNLRTTQSKLLLIEQLRILSDTLNTNPEALSAFLVLMTERHERAGINSRQALEISRKDGTISKLQKTILSFENSEIWKLGQSIWNALQKKGKERSTELAQNGIVHKDDYNDLAEEAAGALDSMGFKASQQQKILSFIRQDLGDYKYNQIMAKYKNQSSN